MKKIHRCFLWFSFLSIFLQGCGERDDFMQHSELLSHNAVKELYTIMYDYYLWYDNLPSVPLYYYNDPETLMEDVVYTPVDRWSFVSTVEEMKKYFETGAMIGYGVLFLTRDDDLWVGYLYDDSPLKKMGVKRGWRLQNVDGQKVNSSNLGDVIGDGQSHTLTFLDEDTSLKSVTASPSEVNINTVVYSSIIDIDSTKAGYMVLESFIEPSIAEINSVFSSFVAEGIDELILDLRYNGGGLISVAEHLGNSIAAQKTSGNIFFKYIFNDKQSSSNEIIYFRNNDYNLGLNRLIVITTNNTASASELVINGLKPYIDVVLVGTTTHGKPVGMIQYEYEEHAFLPVVFETVNANDQGKFYDGIPVDVQAWDDYTKNWGDTTEASLKAAIDYIRGVKSTSSPGFV
ncbi:MAG: S41 family peptidase, partial [Thermoplasmatota archaeon]